MIIRHYDEDMNAEDFILAEKIEKRKASKEKIRTKPIHLDKLPRENDSEVK